MDGSPGIEILLVEDAPGGARLTQEALETSRLPNHLSIARSGEVIDGGELHVAVDLESGAVALQEW